MKTGDTFFLVKDINGFEYFRVTITDVSLSTDGDAVSVDGYVDEVQSWGAPDRDPLEYERYLSFRMKWDECCHIRFGDMKSNPGYLHICGKDDWQRHSDLMLALFAWAEKELPMNL